MLTTTIKRKLRTSCSGQIDIEQDHLTRWSNLSRLEDFIANKSSNKANYANNSDRKFATYNARSWMFAAFILFAIEPKRFTRYR